MRQTPWFIVGLALALVPRTSCLAQSITFAKHVAPIIQQKCQVCHRPGSIAPTSLLTYEDVRRHARKIKTRVEARIMPPWHIDKTVGIQQFKNDRSLTQAQIDTLVRWIDAGAPEGDPKDLPAPMAWPDATVWQLTDRFGPPDMIVKSAPYTVMARGQDKWWRPVVETGLTEPRWVRAIEVKPSFPAGRKVVHHVLTLLEQHEQGVTGLASTAAHSGGPMSAGLFMEWAVGKVGEVFPNDAGKLMLPGAKIRWEVHYYAIGEEVKDDQVELGIWFYPKDYQPKNRTILRMFNAAPESELDIPPGEKTMTQNFFVLPAPARLENFQPHMHMRGKAMSMEAIYPDGRRELLSHVSSFQWQWHINYIYADSAAPVLPKGTTLVFTAWHDNTRANLNNPDPEQWVGWGDRTVDEMAHAWVDVTYLEQADYERLVAERKARREKQLRAASAQPRL
ncbi:MAG: c-type cytochrome [Gemmatimonadaceae bacterium]